MSSAQVFDATNVAGLFTSPAATFAFEDCHHRQQPILPAGAEGLADPYGRVLSSFIAAKEMMYRVARRVDEIGVSPYEGDDPITALLITLAVVAAAAIIAGVVIEIGCASGAWSGSGCDWGWALIIGGFVLGAVVCLAAGACIVIFGPLVIVPA